MTPEQKQQQISEIEERQRWRANAQRQNGRTPESNQEYADVDFLLSLVKSQEADSDLADIEWALVELADGWISFQEREGPHGFYQNARRVLNAIGEDNASRMRSACVEKVKDYEREHRLNMTLRAHRELKKLISDLLELTIQEQEASK